MAISIGDLSFIFLSGNKVGQEENWLDLLAKCPKARRIEAGDAKADSYAAAAVRATSTHFVTVEGDCVVDEGFFTTEIDQALLAADCVLVWPARNTVNMLSYEYGAIRCWPRPLALARGRQAPASYRPGPAMVTVSRGYATHRINACPQGAFGHGFCEGVRLSTLHGRRLVKGHATRLSDEDYRHLLIWMSVGADAENGLWAVYGARLGCKMASLGALDLKAIFDRDWLTTFWSTEVAPQFRGQGIICEKTAYGWDPAALDDALSALAEELQRRLDLPVVDLDPSQSRLFKAMERRENGVSRLDIASMASALDRLANGHRTGDVAVDPGEAARLYRLAIALGSRNAKASLGRMYRDGDPAKARQAIDLLSQASDEGHPQAAYQLGQIHAEGWSVPRDAMRALQYYRLAARRGVAEAMFAAGEILEAGIAGRVDLIGALAFFRAAAKHGAKPAAAAARVRVLSKNLSRDELALVEEAVLDLAPAG